MSAAQRSQAALEHRVEQLEQHVNDLTLAVERLNQVIVESRRDGHIVEAFGGSDDHALPSVDLRLNR